MTTFKASTTTFKASRRSAGATTRLSHERRRSVTIADIAATRLRRAAALPAHRLRRQRDRPGGRPGPARQQPARADLRADRARRSRSGPGLRQRRPRLHRRAFRPTRTNCSKLMDDELHLRRPSPGEIKDLVTRSGPEDLPPGRAAAAGGDAPLAAGRAGARAFEEARLVRDQQALRRVEHLLRVRPRAVDDLHLRACTRPPDDTLEQAQEAKHALVFDKLGLQPGQRLLDVGCGWGSMVRHAARRGVQALGVTLSRQQAEWGQKAIVNEGLQHLAEIRHLDYRDVAGNRLRRHLLDRADRTHRGQELPGLLRARCRTSCARAGAC